MPAASITTLHQTDRKTARYAVASGVYQGGVWVSVASHEADTEYQTADHRIIIARLRQNDVDAAHPAWYDRTGARAWTATSYHQIRRIIEEGATTLTPDDDREVDPRAVAQQHRVQHLIDRIIAARTTFTLPVPGALKQMNAYVKIIKMWFESSRYNSMRLVDGTCQFVSPYMIATFETGLQTDGPVDLHLDALQVLLDPAAQPVFWTMLPATETDDAYIVSQLQLGGADEAYCCVRVPHGVQFSAKSHAQLDELFGTAYASMTTRVSALREAMKGDGYEIAVKTSRRGSKTPTVQRTKGVIFSFNDSGHDRVQAIDSHDELWRSARPSDLVRIVANPKYIDAFIIGRPANTTIKISVSTDFRMLPFTIEAISKPDDRVVARALIAPLQCDRVPGQFGVRPLDGWGKLPL